MSLSADFPFKHHSSPPYRSITHPHPVLVGLHLSEWMSLSADFPFKHHSSPRYRSITHPHPVLADTTTSHLSPAPTSSLHVQALILFPLHHITFLPTPLAFHISCMQENKSGIEPKLTTQRPSVSLIELVSS